MSDNGDRLRGKWDKYAPRYDRDIGFFERIQFGGGREWVCSQATGDVLDVAVGTGRNLPFYPDSVRLTGIDFSAAMLDLVRDRAVELGRKIDLREGDAQALPFPDASFDTVVCTLGLCGFPTSGWRSPKCTGSCVPPEHCCCSTTSAATTN
jgi:ubiquinone/menaquinone biosynthesis C-methylase UbiE